MTNRDKLNPGTIKNQCMMAKRDASNDINTLNSNKSAMNAFVNDTQIKSVSFDQMKLQINCYNEAIDTMISANNKFISECESLEGAVGDEVLIGETILTNKKKNKETSDKMYEKAHHYAMMAASAILPSIAAMYMAMAAFFRGLGDIYFAIYLYWLGKEQKFDSIEASTADLFSDFSSYSGDIQAKFNALNGSFVLGEGFNPAVNSQTLLGALNPYEVNLNTGNSLSGIKSYPIYDMVDFAISQVGVHELGSTNNVEYNTWYYGHEVSNTETCCYAWCSVFVMYCSDQAGLLNGEHLPTYDDCKSGYFERVRNLKGYYQDNGTYYEAHSDMVKYEPATGDTIFFCSKGQNHTGIVVGYDYETNCVYTVEGNSGDQVKAKYYNLDDSYIVGYGSNGGANDPTKIHEIFDVAEGKNNDSTR